VQLDWRNCDVWNVNTNARLFISPSPGATAEVIAGLPWEFLSLERAHAYYRLLEVGSQSLISEGVIALRNFGIGWQVAEAYICESLVSNAHEGWEWYPDPGLETLDSSTLLAVPPAGFKTLSGVTLFDGPILWRNVETLDASRLFRSTGWQMLLCECFSLDKGSKTVFLYQVSSQKPRDHSFKTSQCALWRKALQMPAEWGLTIVYFLNQAQRQRPTGIEFEDKKHLKDLHPSLKVAGFLVRAQMDPFSIYQLL